MGSAPSVAAASPVSLIIEDDSIMEDDSITEEEQIVKGDNAMKQDAVGTAAKSCEASEAAFEDATTNDAVDVPAEFGEAASDNAMKDATLDTATESNEAAFEDDMKEDAVDVPTVSSEAASEQSEPCSADAPAEEEGKKRKKNKKSKKKNKSKKEPKHRDGLGCHSDQCCGEAAEARWGKLAKSMEDAGIVSDRYNVWHPMEVIPNLMRHLDKVSGTNDFTRGMEVNVKGSWECTACQAVSTFINAPAMSWVVHERPPGLVLENDTVSTAEYYGHEFKKRKNDLCKVCGKVTEHACTLETHLGDLMYIEIVADGDEPAPTITIEHGFPDAEHKGMSWQFGVCILFHDTRDGDRHMTNVKLVNGQLIHVDLDSQTPIKPGSDLRKLKVRGADTIRVGLVVYSRIPKTGASKGTVCYLSGLSA